MTAPVDMDERDFSALLEASIAIAQKDQRIEELEGENTLLRAQLAHTTRRLNQIKPPISLAPPLVRLETV